MKDPLLQSIVICLVITCALAVVEISYRSKAKPRNCLSVSSLLYGFILLLGNSVATLLAYLIVKDKLPDPMAPWIPFVQAFFGIFAFEGVMSNTNVSIFDRGVLTIQDWIGKARDPAVASAIEKQAQSGNDLLMKSANLLKNLPNGELNTYLANYLGPDTVTRIENDATATGADVKLYKALELATKAPNETASILKSLRQRLNS